VTRGSLAEKAVDGLSQRMHYTGEAEKGLGERGVGHFLSAQSGSLFPGRKFVWLPLTR
jgi:hypothetical protein